MDGYWLASAINGVKTPRLLSNQSAFAMLEMSKHISKG